MNPKVVVVVGARPQFVKHAAVQRHLRGRLTEVLVHTGQHYDAAMSEAFFEQFGLGEPTHHLGVGSGTHGVQTAAVLERVEAVLLEERPALVLVYGDTNSTLGAALAAVKLGIPIAHVEAGVRSFDRSMPEEVNRELTDRVSSLLFCPTASAVEHLAAEGITEGVHHTGDVMLDVLRAFADRSRGAALRKAAELGVEPGGYLLATLHRPANVDDPDRLLPLLRALEETSAPVLLPLHPRTRDALAAAGVLEEVEAWEGLIVCPPQDYVSFLALASGARAIVTDSGGLQKEAYFLGVPCTTVYDSTPWPETLHGSWNVLAPDPESLRRAADRPTPSAPRPDAFGAGDAGARVVELLVRYAARAGATRR